MVTFNEPILIGENTWLISWSSDQASPVTYRVFRDGVQVSEQVDITQYELHAAEGEVPILEVLDEDDDVPSPAFPAYLTLGWMRDEDCARYKIEEYVSGDWVERAQILAQDGDEFLKHTTGVLVDVTTATWRVTGRDAAGNWGDPLEFVALMVRHPDPPDVEYLYDPDTGKVTLSAA